MQDKEEQEKVEDLVNDYDKRKEYDGKFMKGLNIGFVVNIITFGAFLAIEEFRLPYAAIFYILAIGLAYLITKNKDFTLGFAVSTLILYLVGNMIFAITCGGGSLNGFRFG